MIKYLPIFLILLLAINFAEANTYELQRCDRAKERQFPDIMKRSLKKTKLLKLEVQKERKTSKHSKLQDWQLKLAEKTLNCIYSKLSEAYVFECSQSENLNAIAETDWIWGKKIKLYKKFWQQTYPGKTATVIHELSHKCLNIDGANTHDKPSNKFFIPWSFYADTYAYWSIYGFCLPPDEC